VALGAAGSAIGAARQLRIDDGSRGRGEARESGRSGGRVSSPQCEAPGAFIRRWEAAERRRVELPKLGNGGGGGLGMLGFSRAEAAVAAWGRGARARGV
jgi:hypothetical protein